MNNNDEINIFTSRLLNLLDQNPVSPTYGCFDRNYWHYKLEKDFPAATYQQGILSLALIYRLNLLKNKTEKTNLLNLIKAGITFWSKIQHSDGSFSEWFSNERSHVATSFTSFAISETLIILNNKLDQKFKTLIIGSLEKAAKYLQTHDDVLVTNHEAAVLPFFYNLYLLTEDGKYKKIIKEKIKILLPLQSNEGWFKEYDGPDLGYQTLTMYFLAKYWQRSKDVSIKKCIERSLDFVSYFTAPDGSFGGEFNSRNTNYFLPAGFSILTKDFPQAKNTINWWYKNKKPDFSAISDDRYFIFFFLPNYLEAINIKNIYQPKKTPEEIVKDFKDAGLLVVKNKLYYLILSYKKNGVIKIFQISPPKLIFSDVGYFGRLTNNNNITTQFMRNNLQEKTIINNKEVRSFIITKFININLGGINRFVFWLFGLFNLTLANIPLISVNLSKFIKKIFILRKKTDKTLLKRSFIINEKEIQIIDSINSNEKFLFLSPLNFGSQLYTPSSKISNSLLTISNSLLNNYNNMGRLLTDKINLHFKFKLKQIIYFSNDSFKIRTSLK